MFFYLFGPKEAAYLTQVLLNTLCPLQQLSNPMQTAAGVWPDCRLQTNSLSWARQSGDNFPVGSVSFSVAAEINSNVVDFYFLFLSLSRRVVSVLAPMSRPYN